MIKKAIIPVAGLGTRFLPITKAIPKEMLPVIDKPVLEYIIDEAKEAGIKQILLVNGRNKNSIEDYFDTAYELEDVLQKNHQNDMLKSVQNRSQFPVSIATVRQKQALGLGHAILCAAPWVGKEPFAVLLGDDVVLNKPNEKPATLQLIEQFEKTNLSQIGIMEVLPSEISKYGAIQEFEKQNHLHSILIKSILEKPAHSKTNLAIVGRYVFSPTIWPLLSHLRPNASKEIQLTDAITQLIEQEGVMGHLFQGERLDAGDRLGYIELILKEALKRPELYNKVKTLMEKLIHIKD